MDIAYAIHPPPLRHTTRGSDWRCCLPKRLEKRISPRQEFGAPHVAAGMVAFEGRCANHKRWNPFGDPTRTQDVDQPLAAKALLRSSPPEPRLEPDRAVRQGPPECSCPPSRQPDQRQRASAGPTATFPITRPQTDPGPP